MSECYVGAQNGKQTASGTFVGNAAATKTISLDFTPKKVSVFYQLATSSIASTSTVTVIVYDFDTSFGWSESTNSYGTRIMKNLGYSGNAASRPTFSSGVLTLVSYDGVIAFNSSYTYEWFASE